MNVMTKEYQLTQHEREEFFYNLKNYNVSVADSHIGLEESIKIAGAVQDWIQKDEHEIHRWEGSIHAFGTHIDSYEWCIFIGRLPVADVFVSKCHIKHSFRENLQNEFDEYKLLLKKEGLVLDRYAYSKYSYQGVPVDDPSKKQFPKIKELYDKIEKNYSKRAQAEREYKEKLEKEQQKLEIIVKSTKDFIKNL